MLLWLLSILGAAFGWGGEPAYWVRGSQVLEFILFGLLGWSVFGKPVK